MKPNRYIKAMEIGLETQENGITYFDLKKRIEEDLNFRFGKESELTFFVWFNENFSKSNIKISKDQIDNYRKYVFNKLDESKRNVVIKMLSHPYWLDGKTSKQYYDYLELVESRQTAQDAREASTEANKKASKSIRLAIASIVISGIVGVASIIIDLRAPKPPYNVNVIEDKTKAQRLEIENQRLKEDLYKAEMMLEAYESDTVTP